jgi:hypothetical protein
MKFDPFEQLSKVWETWQTLAQESLTRAASLGDVMGKVETKTVERVETAMSEAQKLTRETLAYNAQLAAEWRKLTLDAFARAAKSVTAEVKSAKSASSSDSSSS